MIRWPILAQSKWHEYNGRAGENLLKQEGGDISALQFGGMLASLAGDNSSEHGKLARRYPRDSARAFPENSACSSSVGCRASLLGLARFLNAMHNLYTMYSTY